MERVLSSKLRYGRLLYQVDWKNWDPDPMWYPASGFKNAPRLLQAYHSEYPDKAGPPKNLAGWLRAAEEDEVLEDHPDDDRPKEPSRRTTTRRSNGLNK